MPENGIFLCVADGQGTIYLAPAKNEDAFCLITDDSSNFFAEPIASPDKRVVCFLNGFLLNQKSALQQDNLLQVAHLSIAMFNDAMESRTLHIHAEENQQKTVRAESPDHVGEQQHEFAFSFVGFSNDKRIFLVNSAAQKQKRKLHNVELTYNATSDIVAPKSFFVAVFMPHPEVAGYFVLRQLSSKFTINSNGTTTISLEKDAMTVEPGDHCAILLPTGYRAAQIKTLPKTQTIIEADFNPSKPVFFAQLFRNDDVPQTTTSHIDSVFIDVTFK